MSISFAFNIGFLCAILKGNYISIYMLFTFFFLIYNNSSNVYTKYLSFLLLGLSFNIKTYVAIFGIVLLFEKRYHDALKACIVALILFIPPFFFLKNGIILDMYYSFKRSLSFGGDNYYMIGIRSFINTLLLFVNRIFNTEGSSTILTTKFSTIFSIFLLICSFLESSNWKKILFLTLIVLLFGANHGYILAFILIPFLFFICDAEIKENLFYYIIFIFLLLPLRGIPHIIIIYNFVLIFLSVVSIYSTINTFLSLKHRLNYLI